MQKVKLAEANLKRTLEMFERIEKQYNELQADVANASTEVDVARALCQTAVKRLASTVSVESDQQQSDSKPRQAVIDLDA
eukprot:9225915-Pyramimonas_sp.AAC.1